MILLQSQLCHFLHTISSCCFPFSTMVILWSNVSSFSRLSSNIYSQIAPLACRKLIIICHFLKAGTMLTAEGDRMKKTAQTLHTVQHEGQQVTAISTCEPFNPKFGFYLLLEKKSHTQAPRNKSKRPGSHNILGGHVFNGLKDFHRVQPFPCSGSKEIST